MYSENVRIPHGCMYTTLYTKTQFHVVYRLKYEKPTSTVFQTIFKGDILDFGVGIDLLNKSQIVLILKEKSDKFDCI